MQLFIQQQKNRNAVNYVFVDNTQLFVVKVKFRAICQYAHARLYFIWI